jgi:nucleotide-binding universal stress UspA family protein
MNKILLPMDGSELAEAAVEVASNMSDAETVFVLLQVVNSLSSEDKDDARDYLNHFVPQLAQKKSPADIRVLVLEGPVAETIIDTAQEEGAGLIVMTTQGSGGLVRWLIGSVAERVVRHAPCPVLTIGRKTLERGLLG